MKRINLISDTVTKPTKEMLAYMMAAEVGDDVFRQDPTVNKLEEKAAQLFNKKAALFCPSGTMTNQIAIKCHTNPLDELICDHYSHVYQYETAGYSFNSGIGVKLIKGHNGKIKAEQIDSAVNGDFDWLPASKLVVIENTCNKGGGTIYTKEEIDPIAKLCIKRELKLHLDGARLFNALVETNDTTEEIGAFFDSISICLSKGLGAPVGSLLIGDEAFIKKARRFRKVMGGGMRQAGFLAAAGIYALDNHIKRLNIDNLRAKLIAEHLKNQSYVASIRPVQSNIVIFDLVDGISADIFLASLEALGVLAVPFGPNTIRFTFHLDILEDDVTMIMEALSKLKF